MNKSFKQNFSKQCKVAKTMFMFVLMQSKAIFEFMQQVKNHHNSKNNTINSSGATCTVCVVILYPICRVNKMLLVL